MCLAGKSTMFDGIYQERWKFSWAMSVSFREGINKVGPKSSYKWGYRGYTWASNGVK